jgi:hypothetical protein
VLEVSLHDLGAAVARSWRFPEALVQAMLPLPDGVVSEPRSDEERLRHFACLANSACDVLDDAPTEAFDEHLARLAERFQGILPRQGTSLASIVRAAAVKVGEFGSVIGFDPGQTERVRKALAWAAQTGEAPEPAVPAPAAPAQSEARARPESTGNAEAPDRDARQTRLAGLLGWLRRKVQA